MAKKRAKIDDLFASTEPEQKSKSAKGKRTSEVKGKSKITLYLSNQVQDDLDNYWISQPRQDRKSKSQITEEALIAWLAQNG